VHIVGQAAESLHLIDRVPSILPHTRYRLASHPATTTNSTAATMLSDSLLLSSDDTGGTALPEAGSSFYSSPRSRRRGGSSSPDKSTRVSVVLDSRVSDQTGMRRTMGERLIPVLEADGMTCRQRLLKMAALICLCTIWWGVMTRGYMYVACIHCHKLDNLCQPGHAVRVQAARSFPAVLFRAGQARLSFGLGHPTQLD
jgi:hypothetical protein